ncbi:GxxExxY protein [Prosthecobacter sp.]|uniref:GxxExxY protein n=1 Tax=Prosthecobacter sp. TaxID=1965333 RepID=UPI002AB902DF|nr:GxxExxY protein [Prosthecobacter sp.]MDZ4403635.1 GxxExxY protein [Prosthecobacter sp.]
MNDADLPHLVIGACMNVHRVLGPGLTRDAYAECLAIELRELEFDFKRSVPLEFDYHGKRIKTATRLDFVVGGSLLLQIRAQDTITKLEEQQLESQLKLSRLSTGLLVNFNVATLRKGIHQITMKRQEQSKT